MDIQVREFAEADRIALRAVFFASRQAAFPWDPPGAHRLGDFDMVTSGERILVATETGGAPVGFASIFEPDSFLHNLFVHPTFQRCGVGRALLASCNKHFSAAGTLKCLKANEAAQQFYLSQGWAIRDEVVEETGDYFLMGQVSLGATYTFTGIA